jgi:putative protease
MNRKYNVVTGLVRILAPFDRRGEAAALGRAGATELYAGVQPDCWRHRYLSATQRTFSGAHFDTEDELAAGVEEAAQAGLPVHLALNAPLYDALAYDVLLGLAERAIDWGVSGVIAGDLGMLERLRRADLPLQITLSVLAGAWNQHSVAFFRQFGIRRVVLPRHLTLDEMEKILRAHPDLEFEAFVMVGKCPNAEALCSFQHVAADQRWPCEIPYRLRSEDGEDLPPNHPAVLRQRRWQSCDRRAGCGLCAAGELLRRGVRLLKVVGRGGPTASKVANVELVARFSRQPDSAAARDAYRERFGRDCDPLVCYYPELVSASSG